MAELKEKLFSEFAPVSTEEWMAKITADLKGVPFEKKLVWKTGEGFNVNPFYRAEDIEGLKTTESLPGEFPYVRGTKKDNDWKVRQNIEVTCFKGANEKALDILNKGVTSLGFIIKGSDVNAENIATLLDGICPECVELNFNTCNCKAEMLIGILADYFKGKGADLEKCKGSVNYDPFKKPLVKGKENENWVEAAAAVLKAGAALPGYKVLAVNAFYFNISQDGNIITNADAQQRINLFRRALLILAMAGALIMLVSMGLTRSIRKLTRKLRQIPDTSMVHPETIQLNQLLSNVTSPRDRETHELEQVFNHLMTRLHESTTNEMTLREGTLQAQLNALQAQINPHFIYNTLNIISAKSMESSNYDVIEICDQFAQMLRYSTDMSSRTATMAEEIENVHNYLMLAKARYENNLEFAIDVPENLGSITVPKLTLQPLVENALTHGYNGYNELRKLTVTGRIEDEKLILCIRDNGTGFSENRLQKLQEGIRRIENGTLSIEESGGHIGLLNTCLRLHFYSNGQMHISIHNDSGAVITMVMPCGMQENQET